MKMPTVLVLSGLAAMSAATAQAQRVEYDGALWPAENLTDATRLPGDSKVPPATDFLKPPSTTPGRRPAPVTTPRIATGLAWDAAQAAIAACQAKGWSVGAAITDAAGVLQLGVSAEGAAPPGRIYTAVYKAVTALAFGKPTSAVRDEIRAAPARVSEVKPNMMLLAGGVPIRIGGRIVGAIGVSGATSAQDEACAQAGLAKIADQLR